MMSDLRSYLGEQIDNSPLVFFRMCFGLLVAAEGFGAILTGWVERAFMIPDYTFPFIIFDWLRPLPGDGMYFYFAVMGVCGLLIMLGWYYRLASVIFFVLWSGVYFMQKTNYNNHYYFLMLMAGAMALFPAHRANSLDVYFGRVAPEYTCSRMYIKFFVIQVIIVYTYAGLNKIYPDWLAAKPIGIWLDAKANYPVIGPLLGKEWFQYFISYGGIIYDTLIGYVLLSSRTRKVGLGLSIGFNLFNSVVFQVGIFPYLMIALSMFFYPGEEIRKVFLKKRQPIESKPAIASPALFYLFVIYFAWQLYLPLRHHLYTGNVLWTEEGHRMAWQMMLRTKSGTAKFRIVDKETGTEELIKPSKYLTPKQSIKVATHPDFTWQFAQYLKEIYLKEGKDVEIYVRNKVSLNRSKYFRTIDPKVDLANEEWDYFSHSDWILSPDNDD
jgi:hypothetical protein